jgi:hypothetical protein
VSEAKESAQALYCKVYVGRARLQVAFEELQETAPDMAAIVACLYHIALDRGDGTDLVEAGRRALNLWCRTELPTPVFCLALEHAHFEFPVCSLIEVVDSATRLLGITIRERSSAS